MVLVGAAATLLAPSLVAFADVDSPPAPSLPVTGVSSGLLVRRDQDSASLDAEYGRWDLRQAELAKSVAQRRQGRDSAIRRQIQVNSDYARWEAEKSQVAIGELERRTQRASEAAEALALAQQAADAARAAADADAANNDARLIEEARRAEDELLAAQEAADIAAAHQESARVAAELEAQIQQQTEAAAIAAKWAGKETASVQVEPIAEQTMYVTTKVNIRTGPGSGFTKVGQLEPGEQVTVNGQAEGFYRLGSGNFVSGQYLSLTKPTTVAPANPPGASASADPNVSAFAWSSYVANVDSQAAIDECTGGLTYSPDISDWLGKPYYALHNHCAGAPILTLKVGDRVQITDVGIFEVVGLRDVYQNDSAEAVLGVPGSAMLQTCHTTGKKMRVVGMDRI